MQLIFHEPESARAAMRVHAEAIAGALRHAGAVPSREVRDIVAAHIREYEHAERQLTKLEAAAARARAIARQFSIL